MIASSAFVLTALTMTGVYMKSNQEEQLDDGYTIDFSALENNLNDKMEEIEQGSQELARNEQEDSRSGQKSPFGDRRENSLSGESGLDNDLDYLPMEVGSGQIEIPGLTDGLGKNGAVSGEENVTGNTPGASVMEDTPAIDNMPPMGDTPALDNPPIAEEQETVPETDASAEPEEQTENADSSEVVGDTLHFAESDGLLRPVSGEVLIPYSMNGTVYFSTLDLFKYNSGLVLAAEQGSAVLACAEAKVIEIFEDAEIGQAVTMELGDGYKITYGQLEALNVAVGSYVEEGEVIGWIAKPTKYYCVEGSNLYLKLTANGTPVNPEALFR